MSCATFVVGGLGPAEIGGHTGKTDTYRDVSTDEHVAALTGAAVPGFVAESMAEGDAGVARDDSHSRDLHRLIGRDTTRLADALK